MAEKRGSGWDGWGERGEGREPPFRIVVVLFVFLNSMYLPIPQILWPPLPPFPVSAFLLQQRSTACVPCPLFFTGRTVYTTTFIIRNIYIPTHVPTFRVDLSCSSRGGVAWWVVWGMISWVATYTFIRGSKGLSGWSRRVTETPNVNMGIGSRLLCTV